MYVMQPPKPTALDLRPPLVRVPYAGLGLPVVVRGPVPPPPPPEGMAYPPTGLLFIPWEQAPPDEPVTVVPRG